MKKPGKLSAINKKNRFGADLQPDRFFFFWMADIFYKQYVGVTVLRRLIWEEAVGLLLIMMVFLAAKYGTVQVVSADVAVRNGQPVVVIDSGHGGNDPGKVGVDGSLEKDINLEIAKRLKVYLEQADVKVIMTREEDVGLYSENDTSKKMADMRNRSRVINEAEANLVVSIHQNSYHEEYVSGGQVFYYQDSAKGKELAEILQKRFTYVLGAENRRLAKANGNYYLLLHVKSPIVIVECGFLSNRKEATLLQQEDYQDRLAWTIHMGILEYLNRK